MNTPAPSASDMQEFFNALQLGLQSSIADCRQDNTDTWHIDFAQIVPDDAGLDIMQRLVPGSWSRRGKMYTIHVAQVRVPFPLLTQFLLLSRMNPDNMHALLAMDPKKYHAIAQRLDLQPPHAHATTALQLITSRDDAARIIFSEMQRQHLTIRAVAESAGVTQLTVSKFKAGGDVMLTTFLQIAHAVGWQVGVQKQRG